MGQLRDVCPELAAAWAGGPAPLGSPLAWQRAQQAQDNRTRKEAAHLVLSWEKSPALASADPVRAGLGTPSTVRVPLLVTLSFPGPLPRNRVRSGGRSLSPFSTGWANIGGHAYQNLTTEQGPRPGENRPLTAVQGVAEFGP